MLRWFVGPLATVLISTRALAGDVKIDDIIVGKSHAQLISYDAFLRTFLRRQLTLHFSFPVSILRSPKSGRVTDDPEASVCDVRRRSLAEQR